MDRSMLGMRYRSQQHSEGSTQAFISSLRAMLLSLALTSPWLVYVCAVSTLRATRRQIYALNSVLGTFKAPDIWKDVPCDKICCADSFSNPPVFSNVRSPLSHPGICNHCVVSLSCYGWLMFNSGAQKCQNDTAVE